MNYHLSLQLYTTIRLARTYEIDTTLLQQVMYFYGVRVDITLLQQVMYFYGVRVHVRASMCGGRRSNLELQISC